MHIPFDKPPLLVEDQIINLKVKGLEIDDINWAKEILSRINYYRLRGYYIHLQDNSRDTFLTGTKLKDIMDIYTFDDELRTITIQILQSIEIGLRCNVAYRLAHEYGGLGYTCFENFRDMDKFYDFIQTVYTEIKRSNDTQIKHFHSKYSGRIPIWCVIEIISMSCLSKLISNLLSADITYISRNIYKMPTEKMLKANSFALSMVRNICAHGNRLFNRPFATKPVINKSDLNHLPNNDTNKFYAILFAMKYMSLDITAWNQYLDKLDILLTKYRKTVDLKHLGLTTSWKQNLAK